MYHKICGFCLYLAQQILLFQIKMVKFTVFFLLTVCRQSLGQYVLLTNSGRSILQGLTQPYNGIFPVQRLPVNGLG